MNLSLISKPKEVYLRPFSSSLPLLKFCFQNFGNCREDEKGRRWTIYLVSKMENCSISQNILEIFFPLSKSKVVYLGPFLSSLALLKFCCQNLANDREDKYERR